jgi:hypothetical protein
MYLNRDAEVLVAAKEIALREKLDRLLSAGEKIHETLLAIPKKDAAEYDRPFNQLLDYIEKMKSLVK